MKIAYTAHATSTGGGRDQGFSRTDDGHLVAIMATPTEMAGSGRGSNPEQFFAVGYSACFLGAMRFAAGKAKINMPMEATTKAHVSIGGRDDGEGFGIEVVMDVSLPGMTKEAAEDLIKRGHVVCPYSHSIKGNVKVTTNLINIK